MEFPRLVYKSAANHKMVANSEEYSQALREGWFASVPEAQGKPAAPVVAQPAEDLGQQPEQTEQSAELDYDKTAAEIVAGKYTLDYAAPQMSAHYKIKEKTIRKELSARIAKLQSVEAPQPTGAEGGVKPPWG